MTTTAASPPAAAGHRAAETAHTPRLRECDDCGLLLRLPALPAHAIARCPRCSLVLRRRRAEPTIRPLALAATGIVLMWVGAQFPFLDLRVGAQEHQTTLISGPRELAAYDQWVVAVAVLATTLMIPLLRLAGLAWVLLNLERQPAPRYLAPLFRWIERLKPWAMIEVFMLGVFVAYTKLIDLAQVNVGAALYALAGLMLVMAAVDNTLDPEAVWRRIDRREHGLLPAGRAGSGQPLGCEACHLVNAPGERECVRCGSRLHRRKPDSLTRTWALLAAAAVLYVPANAFPMLTKMI